MGGLTSPAGDVSTAATHAGNAGVLATIRTPVRRLHFRVDGQWQQITGRAYGASLNCVSCTATFFQRNYRIVDATANAVYGGTLSGPVRVYVIGGVGVYDVRGTDITRENDRVVSTNSSVTRFGLNGGVGTSVKVGHIATFFEVRFHQLVGPTSFRSDGYHDGGLPGAFQFVPISAGIVF